MPRSTSYFETFTFFFVVGVLGELPVLGPFFPLCLPTFQSDYIKAIGLATKCIISFLVGMIAMHLFFRDKKHIEMQKLQEDFSSMGMMLIGMTLGKIAYNILHYVIYGIDNVLTNTPRNSIDDIELTHNTGHGERRRSWSPILFSININPNNNSQHASASSVNEDIEASIGLTDNSQSALEISESDSQANFPLDSSQQRPSAPVVHY